MQYAFFPPDNRHPESFAGFVKQHDISARDAKYIFDKARTSGDYLDAIWTGKPLNTLNRILIEEATRIFLDEFFAWEEKPRQKQGK
jgi:hypothetical protein